MKTRYVASSLLMAGMLGLAAAPAMASDELAGALIGAGTGAIFGGAIGGHDGAVVGGFLGAAIGASAADNDDRYWRDRPRGYVTYGRPRVYYYDPPARVYYGPPRVYAPPPRYWVAPRPVYPAWHVDVDVHTYRDRDGRHDRWHDDDRGRWHR